jgi:Peptidase family M50
MQVAAWRPSAGAMLVFVVSCAIGAFLGYAATAHGFRPALIAWFFVGYAMGIVCHELGHVLCAAIASIPVRCIQVGIGPILLRRRFGETSLELRLLPLSGLVWPYPIVNFRRSRWALFILGGVLGNATIIAVATGLSAIHGVSNQAGDVFGGVVFAQIFMIAATIIPYRYAVSGIPVASDGLQILQLLRQPRGATTQASIEYAALLAGYGRTASAPPALSPAGSRVLYQLNRPDRWNDNDARRDFRESLLRELSRDELTREDRMLVLDALASDALTFGDPELRADLDKWSSRALELGPDKLPLLCTRGAVLVELGRYNEGKILLTSVAAAEQTQPLDRLVCQVFLARAEIALGNAAAARQFACAARATADGGLMSAAVAPLLARLGPDLATNA